MFGSANLQLCVDDDDLHSRRSRNRKKKTGNFSPPENNIFDLISLFLFILDILSNPIALFAFYNSNVHRRTFRTN